MTTGQYERRSILRYERVFGDGFVSSGGAELAAELMEDVTLPQGGRVLDIGGGLGGAAFLFEERFDAQVTAVDLSPIMVELARERASDRGSSVDFRVADIFDVELEADAFDLVWSRDSLLHIEDKEALFARVRRWLAPGGALFVTDYARGEGELSESFRSYAAASGYDLRDLEDYAGVVRASGLSDVRAVDWTPRFAAALEKEVADLREERAAFVAELSEEDFDYLVDRWTKKIGWCRAGDMRAIRLSASA